MNYPQHLLNQTTHPIPSDLQEHVHQVRSAVAKEASVARAQAGECSGPAPLGYRNAVNGQQRTVTVDKAIAPLIVEAFQMAARRKSSLRKIIAELAPKGLVGRSGKPIGVSSLQHLLTNPYYTGLIRHQSKLYRGTHQPLISRTLFDRVHVSLFRRRCR
jgi:site-specific DNA recombinase